MTLGLEATPGVDLLPGAAGIDADQLDRVDRLRAYSRTQQKLLADQLEANGVTNCCLANREAPTS
ncbi:MAG: hypothetical protein R3B67_03750 [Phycisphaerales bacterium]